MHHSHDKANPHQCPACDYGPFTRNNYFTGKLLVERDFTDEQRYYVDKLRHHNQRLHGWGVVCGLKVKQHPNEACRDRFVCIEPGTAIDCCGHEIILREEQCFDFAQSAELVKLKKENDTEPHKLQICIRYRECPTEEIPVLYDECGCDDSACAPNRILESYELGLIVDPAEEPADFHTPDLDWVTTSNPPHAFRVALHTDSRRLYVITGDTNHTVFQVDTENHTVVGSHALSAKALALAVSNNGERLYVVTEADTDPATKPRQLVVLDTANHLATQQRKFDVAGSEQSEVFLKVAPDNRLFALLGKPGTILVWPTTLDDAGGALAPSATSPSLGSNLLGLVIDNQTKRAFTADGVGGIQNLDIVANTKGTAINVDKPSALAFAGPNLLAVISQTNKLLHLVGLNPDSVLATTPALAHAPVDLAVGSGGHWAYVLEQEATENFVQPVSLKRLQDNLPPFVGSPLEVGSPASQIVISTTGTHLYVPFLDDLTLDNRGGVAVLEVSEETCGEIVWRGLEGCDSCDQANCVVLATIENYHVGDQVWDQTDPPADPAADETAHIDRINNRTRRLLPSTQVLYELTKCLLEHGGAGAQGPPGDPGQPGVSVVSADAETVEPTDPADADFDPVTGNIHFKIPKGEPGDPGTGGAGLDDVDLTLVNCGTAASATIVLEGTQRVLKLVIPSMCDPNLTHISGINWVHGRTIPPTPELSTVGLLIAFDHPVAAAGIDDQSVIVLTTETDRGLRCWCEVPGRVIRGSFQLVGDVTSKFTPQPTETIVNGIQFLPPAGTTFSSGTYRVVVKGNFIIDAATKKAVDADHLPPWFSNPPQPFHTGDYTTGDGVEGGTFESWFRIAGPAGFETDLADPQPASGRTGKRKS
jgi:DNA-binding beta-propeller fold protein YncE